MSQVSKCSGKILITQDMRGPEGIRSFKVSSDIQTVQETSGVNSKYYGAILKNCPLSFLKIS